MNETLLLGLGFFAQGLFALRFIVQWIYSERRKESVVPKMFWYVSLVGGILMLIYVSLRQDPVLIIGQASGLIVYSRNIYLLHQARRRKKEELLSN